MARPNQLDGYILVANPGSSSRKYGLYDERLTLQAELHFEPQNDRVVYTVEQPGKESTQYDAPCADVSDAAAHLDAILAKHDLLAEGRGISSIGLRIVAPSAFFMQHHILTDEVIQRLESLVDIAPLHITATLDELKMLRQQYGEVPIVGVSDSAFHRTKPNYAWNYGINIHDADRLDIKRFGYHGLSTAASVDALWNRGKLPPKVIVCHLGSGSSVSAVFHGRSIDTTMGFSPNEGLVMASRSGSITPDAARALKKGLSLDDTELETYLNKQSGLAGIGGSDDIRELLEREQNGDHLAHLSLTTLVHTIHKAIGSMLVAMNGCDLLVFTGTVGERSAIIRKRIVAHLEFCDFILDGDLNDACTSPTELTSIAQSTRSRPIIVIPTNESLEIAKHVLKLLK